METVRSIYALFSDLTGDCFVTERAGSGVSAVEELHAGPASHEFAEVLRAWTLSNISCVSGVVAAITTIEEELARMPGIHSIWTRLESQSAQNSHCHPLLAAKIDIEAYVSCLYTYVGTLKSIVGHPLAVCPDASLYSPDHTVLTQTASNPSLFVRINHASSLTFAFIQIVAHAYRTPSKTLPETTGSLAAAVSAHSNPSSSYSSPTLSHFSALVHRQNDAMHSSAAFARALVFLCVRALPPSTISPLRRLSYLLISGTGLYTGWAFTVHSSYLGGSGALERAAYSVAMSLRTLFTEHVARPLSGLRAQLFRAPASTPWLGAASEASVAASRASLTRLVEQYARARVRGGGGGVATAHAAEGMERVLAAFEKQVQRPVRAALNGELMETVLVFGAKARADMEEILLHTAQQIEAQRLNLQLLAALPAVAVGCVAVVLGVAGVRGMRKRTADRSDATAEMALGFAIGDARDALAWDGVKETCCLAEMSDKEREGRVVGALHRAHVLVWRRAVRLTPSVKRRMVVDLLLVENGEIPSAFRIATVDRMFMVYPRLRAKA